MTTYKTWGRQEWQRWIISLLRVRYGHMELQETPDGYGGDFGIEAFSRDGGAYQCYVADEPTTKKHLHEAQRKKLNEDLEKFVANAPELEKLFLPTKIRRWVLVVPRFESSQLAQLCGTKATEIRNQNLPYVADDFIVHICTDDAWPVERAKLAREGLERLQIDAPALDADAIAKWKEADAARIEKLHSKSVRLVNHATVDAFMNRTVHDHIRGQNIYEQLRNISADICEDLLRVKSAFEDRLAIQCAVNEQSPKLTYKDIESQFRQRLLEIAPKLSTELLDQLASEALADWLIRCPLYFDETEDAT